MKVEAEIERHTTDIILHGYRNLVLAGSGEIREVKTTAVAFCCDEMKKAWGKFVHFGGEYDKETDVSIRNCSPYAECAVWDSCPIQFCPFCGVAIEVVTNG
jgi:hypothetical protein